MDNKTKIYSKLSYTSLPNKTETLKNPKNPLKIKK